MNIYEKLMNIQTKLKAPKNQYNEFGKYSYRSCEDILEGVKPLLTANKVSLVLNDELVQIGDRYYIKAVAKLIDIEKGECVEATAFARESESKKGMDSAQVTGSTSSYARKYALNGLFCIDDTKDSDALPDTTQKDGKVNDNKNQTTNKKQNQWKVQTATDNQIKAIFAISKNIGKTDEDELKAWISNILNKEIVSMKDMTKDDASTVIRELNKINDLKK